MRSKLRSTLKGYYIGKIRSESADHIETVASFSEIALNFHKFARPESQCSIDNNVVEQMIAEYNSNPSFLRFKDTIVVGVLGSPHIVDGQHRLEMVKILYAENSNINDELRFIWYKCTDEEHLRSIFISINRDSTKNQFYVNQREIDRENTALFVKYLNDYHKISFKSSPAIGKYVKTIPEFRDDLIKIGFFHCNNSADFNGKFSVEIAMKYLLSKNTEFFEHTRYELNYEHSKTYYYAAERTHIEQKNIIALKNNNFIQWLRAEIDANQPEVHPFHFTSTKKETLAPKQRKIVWEREFGNAQIGKCPISHCSNELNATTNGGWNAGHIISENNGGTTEVFNLRPICKSCNCSMGARNWVDYDKISAK